MQEAGLLVVIALLGLFLWDLCDGAGEKGFAAGQYYSERADADVVDGDHGGGGDVRDHFRGNRYSGGIDISGSSAPGDGAVLQTFPEDASINFRLLGLIPVHIPNACVVLSVGYLRRGHRGRMRVHQWCGGGVADASVHCDAGDAEHFPVGVAAVCEGGLAAVG